MSNAFLVKGDKVVLVDTGIPGAGPKIEAALAEEGVSPTDVSAIVVTHAHIDHMGNASHLRKRLGAPIIAHRADLPAYSSGRAIVEHMRPTGPFGWLFGKVPMVRESTEPFEPDVFVESALPLHDYGVDARILFTPGHTPGSLSVLTGPGELIAADLIAGPLLGAIHSWPANPPFHYDRVQNLASLEAILALDPTIVYVGHGGPLDPSRVRRWAQRERRKLARHSQSAVRPRLP
ncbi:MBL fold metallo-hydrolase [Mycolicibacterium mucogenicum]|uniref:MBL fold metallo-hydrolase n=1 Tax=Mycolicibacterium TaxID=1866885 RepID=UPI00226A3C37|nr:MULTISPECIES: MBL fold metallo-hydrolase [Mycolicibacterium]MCX8562679.1 MBL fold metallo-hydrolase [Mycolicibacterium mucogenicum]